MYKLLKSYEGYSLMKEMFLWICKLNKRHVVCLHVHVCVFSHPLNSLLLSPYHGPPVVR